MKWKHFPRYWPFVRGIHRSPVNSPHKGQWRGALMFSLICAWINGWVNNREAGDSRHHRAHYDATVMITTRTVGWLQTCTINKNMISPLASFMSCPWNPFWLWYFHYSGLTWALWNCEQSAHRLFVEELVHANNNENIKIHIIGPFQRSRRASNTESFPMLRHLHGYHPKFTRFSTCVINVQNDDKAMSLETWAGSTKCGTHLARNSFSCLLLSQSLARSLSVYFRFSRGQNIW